jgi:hypothetical protein
LLLTGWIAKSGDIYARSSMRNRMGRLHCLLPLWMMLFLTMGMFPFFSTLMTAVAVNQVMIVIVVWMRELLQKLLESALLTPVSGRNLSPR